MDDIDWSKYTDESESNGGVLKRLQDIDEDGLDTTSKYYEERKKILTSNPNYYSNKLKTDYDRIKADTDKDGVVSREEYETYVVTTTEAKQNQIISTSNENSLQLNWTLITSVSIVCVTLIVITLIILSFKRSSKNKSPINS